MALDPEIAARLSELGERLREMPFVVFVWGPGLHRHTDPARKRQIIRDDLTQLLGEGRVLFSEDASLEEERKAGHYTAEFKQAVIADAVVLIPETEGPLVEAALFLDELVGKCIVFTTRREPPGFPRTAYHLLVTYEVEPEEWRVCERVRRLTREFIESHRARRYRLRIRGAREWDR